jgi:hypothetical protein
MTTRTALAAFSNEAKIQRGLDLLGCAAVNFCSLVGICGKTRFMEGMNGVPGRHFNDQDAQTFLSYMERLYDLQNAIDDAAYKSVERRGDPIEAGRAVASPVPKGKRR